MTQEEGRQRHSLGPRSGRENSETVAKQKQLPSVTAHTRNKYCIHANFVCWCCGYRDNTALQPEEEAEAEDDEEHGNSVKVEFRSITPILHAFLDVFSDIISFQHVLYFDVGKSEIEWNTKMKTEIQFSHIANIGQNDHNNYYYIESTTILSDIKGVKCYTIMHLDLM